MTANCTTKHLHSRTKHRYEYREAGWGSQQGAKPRGVAMVGGWWAGAAGSGGQVQLRQGGGHGEPGGSDRICRTRAGRTEWRRRGLQDADRSRRWDLRTVDGSRRRRRGIQARGRTVEVSVGERVAEENGSLAPEATPIPCTR